MTTIGMSSDAYLVAAELAGAGVKVAARAAETTFRFGLLLQSKVKANASGRPGPRIITGDYNRSIALTTGLDSGSPIAWVGTNAPQGRRLELGFVGTDSLGRVYAQPPFPHFYPALTEIEGPFLTAIEAVVGSPF